MSWLRGALYRLQRDARPSRAREQRAEEIAFHIELETQSNRARGMSPDVARRVAEREFDTMSLEKLQSAGRAPVFGGLGRDVRVSIRSLRRDPMFAAVALLTLAVGIGATTAIFTVVNAVLLRPLPYPGPDRLVAIWQVTRASNRAHVSIPNFLDWQESARSFSAIAAFRGGLTTVLGGTEPFRADAYRVSGDFFRVLAAAPLSGRLLTADDSRPGAAPVAVVSESFWRRALGGGDLGGQRVELAGRVYDVVGIVPDAIVFPERAELWIPSEAFGGQGARDGLNDRVIGRLAPGVSLAQAQQEISTIATRLRREYAQDNPAFDARVVDLRLDLVGNVRGYLRILFGAVAFVLLVACVNLAGASLARGTARGREMAIRMALGSGRGRLVRQLLAESTLLAVVGGVFGIALSAWLVRVLVRLAPASIPRPAEIALDPLVLAFAVGISLATGLLVGLAPALFSSGVSPAGALGAGGRGAVGDAKSSVRRVLVGAEVALALMLLAGAGLLLRSFGKLLAERPGFDARGVLVADLSLPTTRYADGAARRTFHEGVLERVGALPGVTAVAATTTPPLVWGPNGALLIEDRPGDAASAHYHVVSEGYFQALGISLVTGRGFTAADDSASPHVALINETLARELWSGAAPLGKRLRFRGMDAHNDTWLTVIGVARDARQIALDSRPVPEVYVAYRQRPERTAAVSIVVKTETPQALATAVRNAIREQGSDVPVLLATMEERVARSVADRRFVMLVLTSFGGVALLLAAVGIYGVLSYSVTRRTKEIGVRVALGAQTRTVLAMIVRDSMRPVLWGTLLGVAGAIALSRVLRGLVYGIGVTDPIAFGGSMIVLIAVALFASWIPARRASRVDPIIALRAD